MLHRAMLGDLVRLDGDFFAQKVWPACENALNAAGTGGRFELIIENQEHAEQTLKLAWAAAATTERPMGSVRLQLDTELFGQWLAGKATTEHLVQASTLEPACLGHFQEVIGVFRAALQTLRVTPTRRSFHRSGAAKAKTIAHEGTGVPLKASPRHASGSSDSIERSTSQHANPATQKLDTVTLVLERFIDGLSAIYANAAAAAKVGEKA